MTCYPSCGRNLALISINDDLRAIADQSHQWHEIMDQQVSEEIFGSVLVTPTITVEDKPIALVNL